MSEIDLEKAKNAAEKKMGIEIDDEVAKSVLAYAARKCAVIRNGLDYLPILYENELCDFYTRTAINLKGAAAYV